MILALLIVGLVGYIFIMKKGWKANSNADLILYQSLPFTWFYVLTFTSFIVQAFKPGDMEWMGFFFLFLFPMSFFAIASTTALGVKGLMKCRETNDRFLSMTSLLSVTVLVTSFLTSVLFPVLFGYILYRKRSNRR